MEIKKNQSLKATFKMKSKFDGNISSEHEGKTIFGCEICGKCSPNKTQLAKHIDAIHKGRNHLNVIVVNTAVLKRVT